MILEPTGAFAAFSKRGWEFCLVFPSTASPSQQENVEFIEFHFIFSHLT